MNGCAFVYNVIVLHKKNKILLYSSMVLQCGFKKNPFFFLLTTLIVFRRKKRKKDYQLIYSMIFANYFMIMCKIRNKISI